MRRMMAVFAMVFVLVPATMFAQDPARASKSPMDIWRADQNSRLIQQLANARKKAEEQLASYNRLADTRDKELMQKLSRAIRDGRDQTLVEVAVSDLNDNAHRMKSEAKFASEDADALMRLAKQAYSRTVNLRLTEPLPVPLTDLLSRARQKVPQHFASIERIARDYGEKSWLEDIK
jgi:predicted transcriptional regulator